MLALVAVVGCLTSAAAQAQSPAMAALVKEAQHDASAQVRRADLAVPLFVRALNLAESSGDWRSAASISVQLGAAYRSTHNVNAALGTLERGVRWAHAAHDPADEANALRMMGNVRSEAGQNDLAVGLYQRALSIAETAGDDNARIAILNALSVTARHQGKLPEALDLAREALVLLDAALARGHAVDAAPLFAVPFNVGKALSDAGDYGPALPYFERAFAAAEEHQMIAGIWHALFDTAEWYQGQGDLDRADEYYRRALVQSRMTESHDMEADTLRGLASIAESRGDLAEAINGYSTALDMYERYGFGAWVPSTIAALARAKFDAGDDRAASSLLDRGLAAATSQDKPLDRTRMLLEVGRERSARHDLPEAEAAFTEARTLAHANGLKPIEAIALGRLAETTRDRGDVTHALDLYAQAEALLDTLQDTIPAADQRATFTDATHAIYEGHVALLMRLHDQHPDAGFARKALVVLEREHRDLRPAGIFGELTPADSARAGVVRRISALQLQLMAEDLSRDRRPALLAALADAERDLDATDLATGRGRAGDAQNGLATRDPDGVITAVQTELRDDEAVLVYAPEHAFVLTRAGLSVVPLSTPPDIDSRIDFFVGLLEGPDSQHAVAAGSAIAAALVTPVLNVLPQTVSHLAISGGRYAGVPFGALPDPAAQNATPLLERFVVTHVPSLSVFESLRHRPPAGTSGGLLAIADPEGAGAPGFLIAASMTRGQRLSPLPYAVEEVTRAASDAAHARTLVGAAASEAALKRLPLSDYEILHFATHALLDPIAPMRSGIVLRSGQGEDGLLQPREILQLRLRADLVVLAGCRTAVGRRSSAAGIQSLAQAFLGAGSRSVLGTLWDVDDRATAKFIDRFYEYAADGQPLAEALREAQRSFAGRHPYATASTWAAFRLIGAGDGHPTVLRTPRRQPAALTVGASAAVLIVVGLFVYWRRTPNVRQR